MVVWVRPVSARAGRKISEEERRYSDGSPVHVLDVIRIAFQAHQPIRHHTENHLIEDSYRWVRTGRYSWNDLLRLVQPVSTLWIDGASTYQGANDCVPQSAAGGVTNSLVLIRPQRLSLLVASESQRTGSPRRRVRADFHIGGLHYRIVVTDPEVEQTYLAQPDGTTDASGSVMCVCLTDFCDGAAQKVAASVIMPS